MKCLRENLCRPSGTRIYFPLYPGLTPWAMIVPPFGLVFSVGFAVLIPPQFSNSSSHADSEDRPLRETDSSRVSYKRIEGQNAQFRLTVRRGLVYELGRNR